MSGNEEDLHARLQREWAEAAYFALSHCDRHVIGQFCAGFLDVLETGGPSFGDPFGLAMSDAAFWADCAPPHELAAYGMAALDRLRGKALGLNTRKRLLAKLWETFDPKERQAFLARVDPDGKFLHRGTE